MPPTKRAKIPDYKRNLDWSRTASQACRLHDHLMDGLKVFCGFDINDGCRSTDSKPAKGVTTLAEDYMDRPRAFPVEWFIRLSISNQSEKQDNLLSDTLLEKISEIYCAFATNDDLEMAQTQQYGESQLMVRAKTLLKASSTQPGLEFLCFPIPEDHDIYEDITFTEDYCFSNDYKQGYIQLGPATLLNHHCDPKMRNVRQLGQIRGRKGPIKDTEVKRFQPSMARAVRPGEELCIDYGPHFFGENNVDCRCTKHDVTAPKASPRMTLRDTCSADHGSSQEALRSRKSGGKRRGGKRKRDSTGSGEARAPSAIKSTGTTRDISRGSFHDDETPSIPLPSLLDAFLISDCEADHQNDDAQPGGSSLTQEQKSRIPKHVATSSSGQSSAASNYPSIPGAVACPPTLREPLVSIVSANPVSASGQALVVEHGAQALHISDPFRIKSIDGQQQQHNHATPPTSTTTRALADYIVREVTAMHHAQADEITASAKPIAEELFSARASPLPNNQHHRAPTPTLEPASSPISDESLYQTTPKWPDINRGDQGNILRSREAVGLDDGCDSEEEYLWLYGEPRSSDTAEKTPDGAGKGYASMDLCTEDDHSGPTRQHSQPGNARSTG